MAGDMKTFDSARRDLLRLSSMGLAASAVSAIPALAASKKAATPALSPLMFDVRTYGATGDGKTVDSPAINKAIEAAEAAGGGTVIFPPGVYMSFSIRLKSKVNLYLDQGSTIIAADSPKPGETTGYMGGTYDAAEPKTAWDAYQDYGHNHWHNSLIWGEGITDVSITGPGLIWGKGLSFGAGPGRPPAGAGASGPGFGPGRPAAAPGAPAPVRADSGDGCSRGPGAGAGAAGAAARPGGFTPRSRGNYPMFQAEQPGVGNKAIALKNCRNVIFRDFSILKGGHFGLLLTGVDNLTIDNLKIDTDRDGMDIDCCKNVRVSNCTVNSPWDDGICPKSSFALGYNRSTDNVNITNCYVTRLLPARDRAGWDVEEVHHGGGSQGRRHRPHQVRDRVERRLQKYLHLELRLRGLPGAGAGDSGRRAAGGYRRQQYHHARHHQLPHLYETWLASARA